MTHWPTASKVQGSKPKKTVLDLKNRIAGRLRTVTIRQYGEILDDQSLLDFEVQSHDEGWKEVNCAGIEIIEDDYPEGCASREIDSELLIGEIILGVCFGRPADDSAARATPEGHVIPPSGIVLHPYEAGLYMSKWKIRNGPGMGHSDGSDWGGWQEGYAFTLWSNLRVFWASSFDSTSDICFAPVCPVNFTPEFNLESEDWSPADILRLVLPKESKAALDAWEDSERYIQKILDSRHCLVRSLLGHCKNESGKIRRRSPLSGGGGISASFRALHSADPAAALGALQRLMDEEDARLCSWQLIRSAASSSVHRIIVPVIGGKLLHRGERSAEQRRLDDSFSLRPLSISIGDEFQEYVLKEPKAVAEIELFNFHWGRMREARSTFLKALPPSRVQEYELGSSAQGEATTHGTKEGVDVTPTERGHGDHAYDLLLKENEDLRMRVKALQSIRYALCGSCP